MSGLESVARMFFARAGAAIAVVVLVHGTGALAQSGSSSDVRSAAPPKIQPRPFLSAATAPLMTAGETGAGPSLQAFARAAHGVSGLRDKYMPRISAMFAAVIRGMYLSRSPLTPWAARAKA